MLNYNRALRVPSRVLRNNMTDAERALWSRLRRKQLLGIQFYRQKPIGNYIVDFYAPAAGLVFEVDGCQHLQPDHRDRDEIRDQYLGERGLLVLRFDNRQVLREMNAVVEHILDYVRERLNPPSPPFSKGGMNCPFPFSEGGPKGI